MSKRENKARFGISMDPSLLREVDEARGLAKRSTYIEFQVDKAFKLDKIRDDLHGLCDDLLNKILVLESFPQDVKSVPKVEMTIDEARERVEKIRELIDTTT